MNRNLTTLLCGLIVALYSIYGANMLHAQVQKDSVRIFFYQGRADLDMKLRSNKLELERLLELCSSIEDTTLYYNNISIKGWTSPEGGISINSSLSKKRADAIIEFLSTNVQKKISTIDVHFKGSDWNRLLDLVRRDKGIPFQAEAINIVEQLMILDEAEKYKYLMKLELYIVVGSMLIYIKKFFLNYVPLLFSLQKKENLVHPFSCPIRFISMLRIQSIYLSKK